MEITMIMEIIKLDVNDLANKRDDCNGLLDAEDVFSELVRLAAAGFFNEMIDLFFKLADAAIVSSFSSCIVFFSVSYH